MLRNAMTVLDLFTVDQAELGVVEVAEMLGRHKSTVSRWLAAMDRAGFLERDPVTARYRVSMRLAAFAEVARRATSLQRRARPILERLSAETGETCNLAVLDGSEAVNVEVVESPRPIMHVGWVGRRLPLHASASGKVLLAWLPGDVATSLLDVPLRRYAPGTVATVDAFEAELMVTRARGYATTWAELEPDLASVAAPVRDHRGEVVAAVSVSAPTSRMERERMAALGEAVVEAAAELSARMGYRPALTPAYR